MSSSPSQAQLVKAIKELDVFNAIKMIQSGQFDLNHRDNAYFGATELNKICCAPNSKYNEHSDKLLKIMSALLQMDDVDLNTVNDFGRSPLGNAIRKNRRDFCQNLLYFGCGFNEDSIKSIIHQMEFGNFWIFELVKEIRAEYTESLAATLRQNDIECVLNVILDFFIPPNESQQIIEKGISDLKLWLLKEFKSLNMMATFINVGVITMNGFELTQKKLQKMNLDKGIKRKLFKSHWNIVDEPLTKRQKMSQIVDVYQITECDFDV